MDDSEPLTPEELDFRGDPSVTALGDGRYVVATDADGEAAATDESRRADAEATEEPEDAGGEAETESPEGAEGTSGPDYFVALAARTDEGTFDARVAGDDIGAVCASMLRWYARCVSPEDDPGDVLSILLSRSDLSLTGPVADR